MNRKPENPNDPTGKIMEELKEVVQDGEDLLRSGAQAINDRGAEVRDRLVAALDSAKDVARRMQAKTMDGARVTDRVIRDNPYQSIGIAFGVGVLIGVLANRRFQD